MPRPIEMDIETRDYITARIREHCQNMEESARLIAATLNIPEGTTRSWIAGRQLPSSKYMSQVLALLGLFQKSCLKCTGFALSEDIDDNQVLCLKCQKLHVIRDGRVTKK